MSIENRRKNILGSRVRRDVLKIQIVINWQKIVITESKYVWVFGLKTTNKFTILQFFF